MNKDKMIFGLGILMVLIIVGTSVFLCYKKQYSNEKLRSNAVVIETQKPEMAKTLEINYKNTEIEVLNATGKPGFAKNFADELKKLGYTKVTIGNYKEKAPENILFAPSDFGADIKLTDYKYQKSDQVKIILGN